MASSASQRALEALAEPIARASGCDLEQISVSPAGRRSVVRVIVDADGGVSLDAVAAISRELSAALDHAEESGDAVLPGAYVLEVSSPGVDRPLREERHWRRNVGRLVRATLDGAPVEGRIAAVADGVVVIDAPDGPLEAPLADLGPGRIQVEFGRPGDEPDEADAGNEPDESDAGGADAEDEDEDERDDDLADDAESDDD